jgi:hypothetical protein
MNECLHTLCPFYRVPQPWHFHRIQHLHPPGHTVSVAVLGDTKERTHAFIRVCNVHILRQVEAGNTM